MEMPKEQISKNLLCLAIAESELRNDPHITSTMMRRYEFDDKMYQTVKYAVQSMREVPVFIDDSPGLTPGELRARARRLHHRDGVRLILIDYLQLMQAGKHHDNREQAVAELSRQVKQLARELSIPVVLLSQLRRPIQGQEAQRPNLTDLRESGAIEQDADVVVMLHREMENRLMTRKAWAIVQKNRNGEIGDTELAYWPEQFRFHNYSAEVEQAGVPVGATA
jgi:replicative DNA helicase